MAKIPRPRKPTRQLKCPWCKKEFMTVQKLQEHEPKCEKRPGNCKHRWRDRKTRFIRFITRGKKNYELLEVYCRKCGKVLKTKKKRTG